MNPPPIPATAHHPQSAVQAAPVLTPAQAKARRDGLIAVGVILALVAGVIGYDFCQGYFQDTTWEDLAVPVGAILLGVGAGTRKK